MRYGLTDVQAEFYAVAIDTTFLQPVYVHNYDWFRSSVKPCFGRIGDKISGRGLFDVMKAESLTHPKAFQCELDGGELKLSSQEGKPEQAYLEVR